MKSDSLQVGNFTFKWGSRAYIMGILNITPDSFSGDGLMSLSPSGRGVRRRTEPVEVGEGESHALEQAKQFLENGADILDIGGESTRPGSQPVTADEELARVIPVIESIHKNFPDAIISIDTSKAEVAEAGFKAGASILPRLASVAAAFRVPVILMHNRSNPASVEVRERLGNAYIGSEYENLIEDVKRELLVSVEIAKKAGVEERRLIVDPGIGFGKKREHNLELINRLDEIRALGYPVLLGTSRKSFIGFTLDLPADQRVEGTAATVAVGITRGADIIRAHDVKEMARVAKMTDAIVRKG
jgi:dihydropteroate synthase